VLERRRPMIIRDLLARRNRLPITVEPTEKVSEIIQKFIKFDRGAFPVINQNLELIGIISERDVVRKCFANGQFTDFKVSEVMTREVAIGFPDDKLEYAIFVMKQKGIRHLPIIENQKVVGMVSMRDVLDVQLSEVESEIRYIGLLSRRPVKPIL
jgi:CBS domain-containing protein